MAKRRKTLKEKKLIDKHKTDIIHETPPEVQGSEMISPITYSFTPKEASVPRTLSIQTPHLLTQDLLRLTFLVGSIIVSELILFVVINNL